MVAFCSLRFRRYFSDSLHVYRHLLLLPLRFRFAVRTSRCHPAHEVIVDAVRRRRWRHISRRLVVGWLLGPPFKARAGPDLRPPVRASRSTGASCAAVTPVGTLTSAGSAVEPTLLSDALRHKPTGNHLAPPSHPQVPLVAPRLPRWTPRMAQTVNYHPQFHWLHYSNYYMVTTLIFYIILYTASVPFFWLAVLACPLRSIRLPSLTLNRLRNFPRSLILNYLRSYGLVECLGLLPCPLLSLSGVTPWCRPEESCWWISNDPSFILPWRIVC